MSKVKGLPWFSMEKAVEKSKDKDGNEVELQVGRINIYNRIGKNSFWGGKGDSAEGFSGQLSGMGKIDKLDIFINSGGGSIFEGSAIVSQIDRKKAEGVIVNTHIEGIAASMASIIAMTGDNVYMPEYALMMIHKPSSGKAGTATDMRKTADLLDKLEDKMIGIYKRHTSKSDEEIKTLLAETTWLDAVEASELFDNIEIIKNPKAEDDKAAAMVVSTLTMMVDDDIEVPEKYKTILDGKLGGELVGKSKEIVLEEQVVEESELETVILEGEPRTVVGEINEIKTGVSLEMVILEARIEDLQRNIDAKEEKELMELYTSAAKDFDKLPIASEDLVKLMMSLDNEETKSEYEGFMNLLTTMQNCIAESTILEELGTNLQTKVEAEPEVEIQKIVSELMEGNEKLTYSLALGKAYSLRPDLYNKMNEGDEK